MAITIQRSKRILREVETVPQQPEKKRNPVLVRKAKADNPQPVPLVQDQVTAINPNILEEIRTETITPLETDLRGQVQTKIHNRQVHIRKSDVIFCLWGKD